MQIPVTRAQPGNNGFHRINLHTKKFVGSSILANIFTCNIFTQKVTTETFPYMYVQCMGYVDQLTTSRMISSHLDSFKAIYTIWFWTFFHIRWAHSSDMHPIQANDQEAGDWRGLWFLCACNMDVATAVYSKFGITNCEFVTHFQGMVEYRRPARKLAQVGKQSGQTGEWRRMPFKQFGTKAALNRREGQKGSWGQWALNLWVNNPHDSQTLHTAIKTILCQAELQWCISHCPALVHWKNFRKASFKMRQTTLNSFML